MEPPAGAVREGAGLTWPAWVDVPAILRPRRLSIKGPHSSSVSTRALLAATLLSVACLLGCQAQSSPPPAESAAPTAAARHAGQPRAVAVAAYDLGADEARGGHTLARHVGRSDLELRERLRRESISAASTYTDRATAERVVAAALERDGARVEQWLARRGQRPNLVLNFHDPGPTPIGRSLRRRRQRTVDCYDALVVLRWDGRDGFYVLTSYPEAPR